MSIGIVDILDSVVSHAAASGWFEAVNSHEPKSAPGAGLTCAVWVERIVTLRSSGLASTSGLLVLNVRVYSSFIQQPEDAIDPNLVAAVDDLLTAYSGDFTLGGHVRNVDLLGSSGTPLSARAGYLSQDNKNFRVMTIELPLIVNDIWSQSP
jgi:hypothetical protein